MPLRRAPAVLLGAPLDPGRRPHGVPAVHAKAQRRDASREDVSVRKEALEGTCDVYPILRSDCGFPGITADQCWERDCGFDDSAPNVAWCYLPWKPERGSGPSGIN